jgi:hypothetical protein
MPQIATKRESAHPADAALDASKAAFGITIFSNAKDQPLAKTIRLVYGRPASVAAADMVEGRAMHIDVNGLDGMAEAIESCRPGQALTLGTILPEHRPAGQVRVVADRRRQASEGAISRTGAFLQYEAGPGFAVFDFDSKQMPARVAARIEMAGDVYKLLCEVFSELAKAGAIVRASTSAGIYDTRTGLEYEGSGGVHIYVAIADQSDFPRALKAAHERLIVEGLGWSLIAANGAMLNRSIVDASVAQPNRLFFEGAPVVEEPLAQDDDARRCEIFDGEAIDSRRAFPDLTADERHRFHTAVAAMRAERQAEADKVRATYQKKEVEKVARARGISQDEAKHIVAARADNALLPETEIHFDDGQIVTVAEIYADPKRFLGRTAADPIEGVSYGRCKAKLYRNKITGLLQLNSHAHGGILYDLTAPENVQHAMDAARREEAREAFNDNKAEAIAREEVQNRPARATSFVMLGGSPKRVVNLADVDARFALLNAPGCASVYISRCDALPITDRDLRRRLAGGGGECAGDRAGKPVFTSAFNAWTENAAQHRFRRVVFTNKPVADDSLNLYRGLGVVARAGTYDLIKGHMLEVICAGDKKAARALWNLIAWQLQNIGRPSRTIVVLKSKEQQVGKGLFLGDVLARIFGPSAFVPASVDQVLGRFNDALRGAAFVFLDEVLFGGDRRAADAVKTLSTTTEIGVEGKSLPIVKMPVAVNLWLASNHDNAAHIEEHDQRYWVLEPSPHRVGDADYFQSLTKEIENGGREAFLHALLTHDVSGFVPWRDVPKNNGAKERMRWAALNPYDARKWLHDSASAGEILGSVFMGKPIAWVAGAEISFNDLARAYRAWQQGVRAATAARPTPIANLGQLLNHAGFEDCRKKDERRRLLPDADACLALLQGAGDDRG